jgi:hypothetical protein
LKENKEKEKGTKRREAFEAAQKFTNTTEKAVGKYDERKDGENEQNGPDVR